MLVFLRVLVLVNTVWALQETSRYSGLLGGIYDYAGFVVRLSIAQQVEQRGGHKMAFKNVDIMNIVHMQPISHIGSLRVLVTGNEFNIKSNK